MKTFKSVIHFLGEFFFPAGCGVCGVMLSGKNEAHDGLCEDCFNLIKKDKDECCCLCGRPLISEKDYCLDCREFNTNENDAGKEKPAYDRLICLFPYTGKYRQLLWTFKYGKSRGAARFLSDRLLEAIDLPETEYPVLVPVPPRPGKIRKTGWDQIRFLSGILKKKSPFPVFPCLVRLAQDTQKKLKREERKANIEGKIRFSTGRGSTHKNAPKVCVVYDDVITTGSTMNACAAALKAAGAEKVYGICLFYD